MYDLTDRSSMWATVWPAWSRWWPQTMYTLTDRSSMWATLWPAWLRWWTPTTRSQSTWATLTNTQSSPLQNLYGRFRFLFIILDRMIFTYMEAAIGEDGKWLLPPTLNKITPHIPRQIFTLHSEELWRQICRHLARISYLPLSPCEKFAQPTFWGRNCPKNLLPPSKVKFSPGGV